MDSQFSDLSVPDINKEYLCSPFTKSSGFTHLMKLVLLIDKFPDTMQIIEDIVKNTPSEINKVNNKGWTALHILCRNICSEKSISCINLLINSGADLNIKNNDKSTCLIMVCIAIISTPDYIHNNLNKKIISFLDINQIKRANDGVLLEIFNLLISNGADICAKDLNGIDALLCLSKNCTKLSYKCTKILIKLEADVNSNYQKLLTIPCYHSNEYTLKHVKLIINLGIDVNSKTKNGFNCLHYLCKNQNKYTIECIKYLLSVGINVNAQNLDGFTPLMIAVKYQTKYTAEALDILIKSGADVNIQTVKYNHSALHILFYNLTEYSRDCINILIQPVLNSSTIKHSNYSPLHIACTNINKYSFDCVKLLIQYETNLNLKTSTSKTCLWILCKNQSYDIFKILQLLVTSGADPNLADSDGVTCLHNLCSNQTDEVAHKCLKFLLKYVTDINYKSLTGYTYLMILCNFRLYKSIKLLVTVNSIDINLQNKKGNTALHLLCATKITQDDINIINMLMYKNYNASITNNRGLTVYQLFIDNKDPTFVDETLEFLLQGKLRLSNTKSSIH